MDLNQKLAGISSKIQKDLSSVLEGMPVLSRPSNFFESLQSKPELITRRVKSGRHPSTGLIHKVNSASPMRPSTAAVPLANLNSDPLKLIGNTKLSTKVIEGWINSTVADAEYLDIPGFLIKSDKRLPLTRLGIDRVSLLNAGIPGPDIDHIYQSLFVHSIAFYQTICKVLEHSEKKYTIVTGLWKVFAILLEYCCKLDHQMMINTLNIEKAEELEKIELQYRNELAMSEEKQRVLENSLNESKEFIKKLQRQLDLEIQKKEEMEDELMQKGSGHEEEVSTRIKFESKVNQMYAKQRDMETVAQNMRELIQELQSSLENKSDLLSKERKKYEEVLDSKLKFENENLKIEEKLKQLETNFNGLTKRLEESYLKIEELSKNLTTYTTMYSESQNDITQRKIELEDKKFEIEIKNSTIQKLEKAIDELRLEKNVLVARISELENIYSEECEKNQHYKQEYTRIKESDNFYAIEYMKYKEKYEQSVKKLEENKEEKNLMKIQLESLIQGYEEYKIQAKKSQERIEEMNKGRRIVEEKNEFLNSRLSEKSEELKDSRAMNLELKQDIEKIKTKENLLENEITTLTIKLRSSEKQYEANKETMQLKINSLSDIISSEKRIREDWILKFEEEQKNHSSSNRLLIATQDHHNELVLKINSLSLSLDEKNQKVNMLGVKNSEQLEEILELKAFHEELQRRNKTLQMLYENSEKERLSLIVAHKNQIDVLNELHTEVKESLLLSREELIIYGSINLQNYLKKSHEYQILQSQHSDLNKLLIKTQNDLELLKEDWNKKNMHIEDLHIVIQNTSLALSDLEEKHYILNNAYDSLNIEHQRFISLIPEDLKTVPDPFSVLAETIKQLSETLEHIEYMKSNMIDFEVQYDYIVITFDENTQTDIGFSFFEKNRRNSIAGTPQSGSQRVYSAKSKDAPATILEFPGQKKDRNLLNVSDVAFRDETPMNMKSVYNQSFKHLQNFPAIKNSQNSFQLIPAAPPDIKRLIKTANSRRKHDTNFL